MFAFDTARIAKPICRAALLCCGCGLLWAGLDAQAAPPQKKFEKGRLLVKMKPGVLPNSMAEQMALSSAGASVIKRIPQIGVSIVRLSLNANEEAKLAILKSRPEVEFAELDELLEPASIPNDPKYPQQWHLPKINAPAAWDITTGSASIVIAILDTGVDSTHPDLAANIVSGWNVFDNNSNTADVNSHGTSVAGTAAAIGNNGSGCASPTWNCRIMPIRVSYPSGCASFSTIANGLVWAQNHGARVANISYNVSGSNAVRTAAQNFQSAGGVVIVAAGNDAMVSSLLDNPYVVTVSATDLNDAVCSWSNTGTNIDLAAPGSNIQTTIAGGGYSNGSGTSCSAPLVAGVAALMLSVKPSLSGAQIQQILKLSADDRGAAGWDPKFGWGRLNAAAAVEMALSESPLPPPPPPQGDTTPPTVAITSPASGVPVSGQVSIKVSASDNVGVAKVQFYIDGVLKSTDTSLPYEWKWQTNNATPGQHIIMVKAYDAAENVASTQITVHK